jgi:hypothetical protein
MADIKPRVVAAAATMSAPLPGGDLSVSKRIEAAMIKATEDAMAEGIVDGPAILKLKLAARDRVKAAIADEREAQRAPEAEAGE